MIETPTVFVLGAGASEPYRYPTGVQLRTRVLQALRGKGYLPLSDWLDREGLGDARLRCAEAFERSSQKSLDAFLEHRKEFEKVGKLAMAYLVMRCEDDGSLFSEEVIPGDWLTYLLSAMSGPFDSFGDNAVSFITFNYDRILEHFLFNAVQNNYGKSDAECAAVLKQIPIVHVHGCLGPLPWQEVGGRPYVPPGKLEDVRLAADRTKIVHEGAEEDPEFNEARALIRKAERIYFLGFGYNKDNVARLHLGECKESAQIHGTALNLSKLELSDATMLLRFNIGLAKSASHGVLLYDYNCHEFLRNDPVRLD